MKLPKIENMESSNGNSVPNQFVIHTEQGRFFQSYGSIIAAVYTDGRTVLDQKYWDYSNTTGKYRNQFLGEKKAETLRKISDGDYTLENLNA
jgi:hypothetical protein